MSFPDFHDENAGVAAPILFNFKGLGRAINVDSKSIMKDWAIGRQIILSHQIKIGT